MRSKADRGTVLAASLSPALMRPKRQLPIWLKLVISLVPAMVILLGGGVWFSSQTLQELGQSAYDRSLNGAIRAIDLNINATASGIGVAQPFHLFEAFRATADGEFYFRVSTDDGLVEIGDAMLPNPPSLSPNMTIFFDATYLGKDVRVGAFMRPIDVSLYGRDNPPNLIIEVAETLGSRAAFSREIIIGTLWRDAFAIFAAGFVMVIGVLMALRPLYTLRERIDHWHPHERQSLDDAGLPPEVRPLVLALNRLVKRQNAEAELQRRFIDDASHQLKTPIAVLRSQADFARRSLDPKAAKDAVDAMLPVIERMGKMTTQLLALARASAANSRLRSADTPVEISNLLADVIRLHLGEARKRNITPSLDCPEQPIFVLGDEALLFEAISNLIENALQLSPKGAKLTVSAQHQNDQCLILIQDEGPGMCAEDIGLAGERFRGAKQRRGHSSTGLGLSIASAIVKAHGGTLSLQNRAEGGLEAQISLSVQIVTN